MKLSLTLDMLVMPVSGAFTKVIFDIQAVLTNLSETISFKS